MAKLEFRCAVMNSGKSHNLLSVHINYTSIGRNTVLFSHTLDNRFGEGVIASRSGLSAPSIAINDSADLFEIVKNTLESGKDIACVLCDEAQFYTVEQIDQLSDIVDFLEIPVIAFGLKNTYQGKLFPASQRLLEVADKIEPLKTVCHCGCSATEQLKFDKDGTVIREGDVIEIGAETRYVSVCRKHWKLGEIGPFALSKIA